MITVKEMAEVLGLVVLYRVSEMRLPVTILDARRVYGKTQYNVSPVGGLGKMWVDSSSVQHPNLIQAVGNRPDAADDFQAQEQDGLIY
jgi:hypothetical protein